MAKLKQEADIIPGGKVSAVMVGFVVSIIIGVVVARGIESCRSAELGRTPGVTAQVPPEVNAIETVPFSLQAQGLDDNLAAERWLNSYGWVDRKRQVVHIPIGTAIDLYLQRRAGGPSASAHPTSHGAGAGQEVAR